MYALKMVLREVLVSMGVIMVLLGMAFSHNPTHDRRSSVKARWALRKQHWRDRWNRILKKLKRAGRRG